MGANREVNKKNPAIGNGSVTLKLHTKFEILETFLKISRLKPNIFKFEMISNIPN